ncbi:MAG: META domain-containing protein [Caldilineales bacterium]
MDATGLADTASMEVVISAPLVGTARVLDGADHACLHAADPATGLSPSAASRAATTATPVRPPWRPVHQRHLDRPDHHHGRACDDAVMQQEQAYLARLQAATSYTITGSTLTLGHAKQYVEIGAAVATPAATQSVASNS